MKFATRTTPFMHAGTSVATTMRQVILALLPVVITQTWFFGPGVLLNVLTSLVVAVIAESCILKIRGRDWRLFINDYSAVITALLLALCLPPGTPWWITVVGTLFAIVIGKHLYGGLGYNIFNPAMAGYAAVLISFPEQVGQWRVPDASGFSQLAPSLQQTLQYFLSGQLSTGDIDAFTRATPLDSIKVELNRMQTLTEITEDPVFGSFGGRGWEWINAAGLLGGIWLIKTGVIRWYIPFAMLITIIILATTFSLASPDLRPTPFLHLFSGATMLGAFFVATDPVSAPASKRGMLIYGAGTGLLVYVLRTWGAYPDGIAFAVLLMNLTVPLLDRYTQPPVYGHGGRNG
ncbi:MAG: RnfABCDGE type electron transport complex subunit D [Gammaproteobacteria bacterium]